MKVQPIEAHEQFDVTMDGATGTKMRMLVGPSEGAANFHMRHVEVIPGGHTPHHCHDYEHEILILSGEGYAKSDQGDRPIKAGDVLVVWKLDRLGRSMAHLSALLEELRLRSVGFISVTEGIDTTTASGRMLYGLLAVFAEFERAQISERTRAGMAAAKMRGRHVGRLSNAAIREAHHRVRIDGLNLPEAADELGVSGDTLARSFERLALAA